jgi:hypothetical protein
MPIEEKTATRCTCPNCNQKFNLLSPEDHLPTCPRYANYQFPKYMMVTGTRGEGRSRKREFLTISEAGQLFDCGSMQVEIGRHVLEEDFSVRPVSNSEKNLISQIADKYSESK